MSLISATSIAFRYPSTANLFENLTFSVNPGDRIAIAGPNGCGKTTLLSLLEGALEPAAGAIVRRAGLRFATAAQQAPSDSAAALLDFVQRARPALDDIRRRLPLLERTDPIAYAAALHDYMDAGGFTAEAETAKTLSGLGFTQHECALQLCQLSAGQRRRAALARALCAEADLLLLDEPTNHLDLAGREWLAAELASRRQACIVISHDRALLRAFATRFIDIGRRNATVFEGSYDEWRAARDLLDRQAWAGYEAAQRRKAAAERAAAKRAQLARKVAAPPPGAHHGHDFYQRKAAKVDRTARILRERSVAEAKIPKPYEEQPIPDLTFENVPRTGGFPLRAEGLAISFGGNRLFSGLDLQLPPRARLAIAGPNGCGKTTLLRILAGLETPGEGRVLRSAGAKLAFLLQDASHLDPALTPLETCGVSTFARTLMGCLKLRPDCVNRPITELSPGERVKVALVQLLSSGANLLLLDEPTEHLEIEAREALEQALAAYPGALVVISHDRAFLDALGPDLRIVDLGAAYRNENPIRNVCRPSS